MKLGVISHCLLACGFSDADCNAILTFVHFIFSVLVFVVVLFCFWLSFLEAVCYFTHFGYVEKITVRCLGEVILSVGVCVRACAQGI